MESTIKFQLYIFLTSIYSGMIAGLVYDLYRVTRYYLKPNKIATGIEDLLFWIGEALIFFYIFHKSNWGELRGYIFIGFFLGGVIYIKVLSRVLFNLLLKIINGIIFILKWIFYVVKFPFRKGKSVLLPVLKKINRMKRIPKEAIREIRRRRKIIAKKK